MLRCLHKPSGYWNRVPLLCKVEPQYLLRGFVGFGSPGKTEGIGSICAERVKVWSDSESSLHSIASIDIKNPIAQQAQEILLKSTNIKLGWIRAHVGYSGNEAADVLAKKATLEGSPTYIEPYQESASKRVHAIIRWQGEWDNREAGRSVYNVLSKVKTTQNPLKRPEIIFVTPHGPFPTYLKLFKIRNSDSCGCGNPGNPLHYATSYPFITSYHLTKPSADLEPLWWKIVMNNNYSRAKIRKLIHFIAQTKHSFLQKMVTTTRHRLN
ncbi:hypothetical protein AVEN_76681-1 [Araneus ventricosus]|uniref:RNase H type-1 domain-containing protein n=1 Tax=Araneus ventricosus TaxID=182803 RepID=A0A4Y2BNZ5_ARAVE|nr:hypothetical protein AVEN_76681-1 [Araneus ventricosus]